MSELRQDPVTGRWVIMSTGRAKRPHDIHVSDHKGDREFCPFCEGNEHTTPEEVFACRPEGSEPNTPGWQLRVVPNKYPALELHIGLQERRMGVFKSFSGVGMHEVFIEFPRHVSNWSEMDVESILRLVKAYKRRISAVQEDKRLVYALVFKNVGALAGASLEHSHSQLIATPMVPKRIREEMDHCEAHYEFNDRCLLCEMVEQELKMAERVVSLSDNFVVIAPYASRFPFELVLLPRSHLSHFEMTPSDVFPELAGMLHHMASMLDRCLGSPPYNLMLHNSPFTVGKLPFFHWHMEIIPRLTHVAGYEWGTGFYINQVMPREAARYLREAGEDVKNEMDSDAVSSLRCETEMKGVT